MLAAIASAHPAIEVLDSRFTDPDAVDPLSALADGLSHFGLVARPGDCRLAVDRLGAPSASPSAWTATRSRREPATRPAT